MASKHDPSNYTMSEPEAETTATIPSHRAIGEPLRNGPRQFVLGDLHGSSINTVSVRHLGSLRF